MKYLRILIAPLKIKGDPTDRDQLQQDLFERIQTMIEDETLDWDIDEDESEDEDSD